MRKPRERERVRVRESMCEKENDDAHVRKAEAHRIARHIELFFNFFVNLKYTSNLV